MPDTRSAFRALAAFVVLLSAAPACRDATPPAPAPAEGPGVRRYTVRGEVVKLPGGAEKDLSLHHEPIHDFADRSGAVVGMNAMTMPFAVEPSVSLDGVEPGDKVRVRFSIDWERNRLAIESLEELPADTALEFGKARPPVRTP